MKHPGEIRQALAGLGTKRKNIYSDGMTKWGYSAPFVGAYHKAVMMPDYLMPFSALWNFLKPKRYLVIGVLLGTAESYAIYKTGHHPDLIVACDIDYAPYNAERTNLAHAYINITGAKYGAFKNEFVIVRQDSAKAISPARLGPYDLIYVDGAHSDRYVKIDMETGKKALAPGGVMIVHDIINLVGKGYAEWLRENPEFGHDELEWELFFTGLGMVWRKSDFEDGK